MHRQPACAIRHRNLGCLLCGLPADAPLCSRAVLRANWLGDSREAWQERIDAGPGASSVSSMLRKHGIPQRLSEAICMELDLQDRRYPLYLLSPEFLLEALLCIVLQSVLQHLAAVTVLPIRKEPYQPDDGRRVHAAGLQS